MKTLKNLLIEAYGVTFVGVVTFFFAIFALTISALGASKSTLRHWIVYPWSKCFLVLAGVKPFVEGREHLDLSRPMVWIVNHRSLYDTPMILLHEPVFLSFIGKRSIREVPLFGPVVEKVGMLFVDRDDSEQARATMEEAGRLIQNGTHVMVCPEGRRSQPGEGLLPFKKGAFYLALSAGVPIQPMVVLGTERILPPGSRRIHSGSAILRFGKPIELQENETVESLMERTRTSIQELIDQGEPG